MNNFQWEMNVYGFSHLGECLSKQEIDWFHDDLISQKTKEINQHGIEHLIEHKDLEIMRDINRFGGNYLNLLEKDWLNSFINQVLNEKAILHGYFGHVVRPDIKSNMLGYKFHRDQPWFKDIRTSVLILIPLVDFTVENGATEFVPGTHLFKKIPPQDFLNKHKKTMIIKAGEVMALDACIWHRTGRNCSSHNRPLLLLNYQLPFFKQPINPMTTTNLEGCSELIKQRLGYHVRSFDSHLECRLEEKKWKSGQYDTRNCHIHEYHEVKEYE